MSKIIFNEKNVIEDLFNKNIYTIEEYSLIQILIKYYYLENVLDKLTIREKVIESISKANSEFNRANWSEYIDTSIEKMIKNIRLFKKVPKILDIDNIEIYEEEIKVIESCKYIQHRRILFVLLVLAKAYNKALDSNEGWINEEFSNILKQSKSKVGNNTYRLKILKLLKDEGYINVFFKNGKCNIKINYLKSEGNKALEVNDFENIIYSYLTYKGEKWVKCEVCNKYIKQNSKKPKKYCEGCIKEKQKEWQKESMKKMRK